MALVGVHYCVWLSVCFVREYEISNNYHSKTHCVSYWHEAGRQVGKKVGYCGMVHERASPLPGKAEREAIVSDKGQM